MIGKLEGFLQLDRGDEITRTWIQINISNLDTIQDQHGVVAMDQLATHIADTLHEACEGEDVVAKITDDCYGILTDITDQEQLKIFGEKLREIFDSKPLIINDLTIEPEFYMGAVHLDEMIEHVSDAFAASKLACDYARENNLNELYLFERDPATLTGSMLDQKWADELQEAIDENRLKLQFQPIISTNNDNVDRYQVYTQLVSKEGMKISVAGILPSIERSGVASMFDRWVVDVALNKLEEHSRHNPNSQFFIKLTAGAVSDESFIPWLSKKCKNKNIDPVRVIFDLREEIAINNLKETRQFATELQSLNFQIAIDSFGIGQDPSKILSMIPAAYLKLSFDLISGIKENNPEKVQAIKNICEVARDSGTKTVAQFVENAEVLSQLWTMNIDYISGDFFCKVGENLEYDFSSAAA